MVQNKKIWSFLSRSHCSLYWDILLFISPQKIEGRAKNVCKKCLHPSAEDFPERTVTLFPSVGWYKNCCLLRGHWSCSPSANFLRVILRWASASGRKGVDCHSREKVRLVVTTTSLGVVSVAASYSAQKVKE